MIAEMSEHTLGRLLEKVSIWQFVESYTLDTLKRSRERETLFVESELRLETR